MPARIGLHGCGGRIAPIGEVARFDKPAPATIHLPANFSTQTEVEQRIAAAGHGVAQANVRERLKLLHDVEGRFEALLEDGVYQVRIEVPA